MSAVGCGLESDRGVKTGQFRAAAFLAPCISDGTLTDKLVTIRRSDLVESLLAGDPI